ncbi:hypothetical protein WNY78_13105 [Psychroserpens sp. AS72]|uniref:hypothetical protein n=1 Tax=Psychroserpens sp. AS72 TaxID=3135775 RepID=UPI00318102C8
MNLLPKAYVSICIILCLVSLGCEAQIEIPQLINYSSSECEEIYYQNRRKVQNRILNYTITDSSLVYKVFIATNCNSTDVGEIAFKNDTLKLIHHGVLEISEEIIKVNDSVTIVTEVSIEEVVECDCAYELMYEIKGLKSVPKVVTLNDELITKTKHKYKVRRKATKFNIVNNDTINLIDIYGLKQKTHITLRPDGKLLSRIYFVDNQPIYGLVKVRYNANDFDRIELHMENGIYTKRKYYKNGKLFKICDTKGVFDDDTNCIFAE